MGGTEMTADQLEICKALATVTYLPGSWDKRMGTGLRYYEKLTDKQNEWMYRLLYKYRRQISKVYEKHKDNPLCSQLKRKEI
jgi:hypothetical protein